MKRSVYDWVGTLVWVLLALGALFVGTKSLWFDGLAQGQKALFWTTLIGPVVAAIGWYVAASENYRRNRELEAQKNERERRGAIRRINLLLRAAIHGLDSFFWTFKALQLDGALTTWTQLRDLLHDPAAATALSDADYRALEDFWSVLGQMIALAQDEMQRWTAGGEAAQGYPATSDERRQYLGQLFADPLSLLKKVVGLIGDDDVRREFADTESHAAKFKETMEARIAARNARFS